MTEIQKKPESFHEKQRRLLNIPNELNNSPVLYLSSHSGVVQQLDSFTDAISKDIHGGKSSFVDLTTISAPQVIEQLYQLFNSTDVPPSKAIFNIIFLPALDQSGNSKEPSTTFAIDIFNYQAMLPKLKEFLSKKLNFSKDDTDITKMTSETKRKLLKTHLPE